MGAPARPHTAYPAGRRCPARRSAMLQAAARPRLAASPLLRPRRPGRAAGDGDGLRLRQPRQAARPLRGLLSGHRLQHPGAEDRPAGLLRQLRLRPRRRPRGARALLRHRRHGDRPLLLDPPELQARPAGTWSSWRASSSPAAASTPTSTGPTPRREQAVVFTPGPSALAKPIPRRPSATAARTSGA